jgi:cobalt-zinc-cadmium efflux system membrane fusion protein
MTNVVYSPTRVRTIPRTLLIVLVIVAAACGKPAPAPQEMDMGPMTEVTFTAEQIAHGAVKWAPVATDMVADSVEVPGHLVPDEDKTARLSVSVRGRVTAVRANVGDAVTRGQVLVVLQSEDASARHADFAKATAALAERQAALHYARTARERAERLLALKSGSAQDLERARADEAAAEAGVAQANAAVEQARTALSVLEVDAAGQIQMAAPIAGVVIARGVVVGSVVDPGAVALIVTDPSTLWLEFGVTDIVATSLQSGQRLRFVSTGSAEVFEARVLRVSGAVDPSTRLVPVRATVVNPRLRLRPEMFVTVRAETTPAKPTVTVPQDAVQLFDGRPAVFIAEPDGKGGAKFTRRDVETGSTADGRTRITKGLASGDVVVTAGAFAVRSSFSHTKMKMG